MAIRSPLLQQQRLPLEHREEQLIVRAEEIVDQPADGGARRRHLRRRHAAADVERDAKTDRHADGAEADDFLRTPFLGYNEVVGGQTGNEPAVAVDHRRGDVHEIDAAAIHRLRGRTRGIRGETRHQDGNAKGCGESFPHGPANQYPSGTWFHGSRHSR